ncbi:MAG: 2-amino-4-hydroxy-6-hydroxymethyldihydropteridine diphosphokinase [Planctomycetota bacterium]
MIRCLIALGSNEGPPEDSLAGAVAAIDGAEEMELVAFSPWHRTASVGGPEGQPDFLNGAAVVETELPAEALLDRLLEIERQLGRVRRVRWGQRTLDLDLLLYGDQVLRCGDVEVPHPRMSFRRFVVEPAAQIAGQMLHPPSGCTLDELLTRLREGPRYAAVVAPRVGLATWLTEGLHARLGCPVVAPTSGSDDAPGDAAAYRRGVHSVLQVSFWESAPGLVECLSNETDRPANEPPPAVSPFWLPAVETACGGPEGGEVVEPTLVIAWLPAADVQLPGTTGAGEHPANLPAEAVHGLLKQDARGPLLVIETAEPEEALHEAAAAVAAAWPSSPTGNEDSDGSPEADD